MGELTAEERLPFIDEHAREMAASPERVWAALSHVLPRAFGGASAERFARAVGCEETASRGAFPVEGSILVGFRVARAEPARLLSLVGRHRYADYALVFHLEQVDDGRATRVRAETRALFPGLAGRTYRFAVIGTGGHKIVVRRLLRALERRALRDLTTRDGTPQASPLP